MELIHKVNARKMFNFLNLRNLIHAETSTVKVYGSVYTIR